jgi:hypothetical protein
MKAACGALPQAAFFVGPATSRSEVFYLLHVGSCPAALKENGNQTNDQRTGQTEVEQRRIKNRENQ